MKRRSNAYAPDSFGCLLVECWCRLAIVNVPAEDVKAGRTGSCDSPGCKPPEEDA